MKRTILLFCLVLAFCSSASADDVTLSWDAATGATGYNLYMSLDGGATWEMRDIGNATSYVWTGVPNDQEVRWKIGAYNTIGEAVNEWATVNYDATKKPPAAPVGLGVH